MKSKVFISCGQNSREERDFAVKIANFFAREGYVPHVAIEVQSALDINAAIIGELKSADYYVFVNFRRELILSGSKQIHRGSLFANQELAIAYALEFEHMLFLNQRGALREGIFKFLVTNASEFETFEDAIALLAKGMHRWSNIYSRQLRLTKLRWSRDVKYNDHSSKIVTDFSPKKNLATRRQRMLLATIENNRVGKSAVNAATRLKRVMRIGDEYPLPLSDRTSLKASGHDGYTHTIWPQDNVNFDLLAIHLDCPREIFLNSNHDFGWRAPIINKIGSYMLDYEIFAEGFPLLQIQVELDVTGTADTTIAKTVSGLVAYKDSSIADGLQPGPWEANVS